MIPILYEKAETNFSHNGIGYLVDAVKVTVIEGRNGVYELTLQYPITGMWYDKIEKGSIIKAKANDNSELQLFRIYKVGKPLKGVVTYSAEHISYDLNGIPTLRLSVENATPQEAMTRAINTAVLPCPFSAYSDITTRNGTVIPYPCSVRSILGGQRGSILDVWGGEYEFDNFIVKLHKNRGRDNGVTIEYGKNLTDLKQEENISECYTHILPYAKYTRDPEGEYDENAEPETVYIYLAEKVLPILNADNIGHTKTYIIDLSDRFDEGEQITEQALREKTDEYLKSNPSLGAPKVNITVSFVPLWQTEEYKNIACLERVNMCDIVTVRFSKLGVESKAKVIKTVYDSLNERYDNITLGDAKETLTDTIIEVDNAIKSVKQSTERMESHITRTDERITLEVIRSKGAEEELSSRIELTAESITAEVKRATAAEGTLSSRIEITAESITSEVTRAKSEEEKLSSRITQTAESITAEIIRATAAEEELSAKVELTAESITSTIEKKITEESDRAKQAEQGLASDLLSGLDGLEGEIVTVKSEMISQIEQTAESITLSVEAKITAETDRATAVELSLSSSITQTAESITSEVTRAKSEEEKLSSRITQTAESITSEIVRATEADEELSSRITQTANSITSEVTRAKGAEDALSTRISQTFNSITLSVSTSTSNNQTTSTIALKNGNTTISSTSVVGTTSTQAATIAADAIKGITLSVSTSTASNQTTSTISMKSGNTTISSTTIVGTTATQAATIAADAVNGITLSATASGTSATLTMKNGNTTIDSATISFTGLVTFNDLKNKSSSTVINGDNITTGTISADRIDVSSLYISNIYSTASTNKQIIITSIRTSSGQTSLILGGSGGSSTTSNCNETLVVATSAVRIGSRYDSGGWSGNLYIDISNRVIRPTSNTSTSYDWNLGTSTYPFATIYVKTAQLGNSYQGKLGFFGTNPASRQSVTAASTSSSVTASAVATSLNALITALKTYGLIS